MQENTTQENKNLQLPGNVKAALMVMLLDPTASGKIWPLMRDDEIIPLCKALGKIPSLTPDITEKVVLNFVRSMTSANVGIIDLHQTEKILQDALPKERVGNLMQEIRGPKGNNIWEKISNIPEEMLADYLKNEYPQTIAVILSYVSSEQAAKVMTQLPQKIAVEVVERILKMKKPQREMLSKIEKTLHHDLVENTYPADKNDSNHIIAGIFDNLDNHTFNQFLSVLENKNQEAAENIKSLMFTFDDLDILNDTAIQLIIGQAPRENLIMALKGVSPKIKEKFLANMSERARKTLNQDIEILGPVKLKEVDKAQSSIVKIVKELAEKNQIFIEKNNQKEEMVY